MIRTNSKKYKTNIENYLINAISGEAYDLDIKTPAGKIGFLFDTYFKEYEHPYIIKAKPTIVERVAEWLSGLPSIIDIPFYNCDIIDLAEELLETENLPKKTRERIVEGYWFWMAKHLFLIKEKHQGPCDPFTGKRAPWRKTS